MNYIYDILLNFNEKYYEFYDWDDNPIHIKKIPLFKISNEQMKIVFNNNVKIDIKDIMNKTESFDNKIETCIVLATENITIALKLDKNGKVIERSSLLFEEEDEVLEAVYVLEEKSLNIEIINGIKNNFLTREDNNIYNFVMNQIDKLIINKEENKLLYLYYECFNIKDDNINKVIKIIKKSICEEFDKYGNIIYNFLKLTTGSK